MNLGNCSRCGQPLDNCFVTDETGPSHRWCYWNAHPPKPKQSIYEVLYSLDNPSIARALAVKYLPAEIHSTLIAEFNAIEQAHWERARKP